MLVMCGMNDNFWPKVSPKYLNVSDFGRTQLFKLYTGAQAHLLLDPMKRY